MTNSRDISASLKSINPQLAQVKELINAQLNSSGRSVEKLLTTFNCCSGKMLRPALVLLSASACEVITPDHIHVAAMLEMIHTATLLHDDVIDDGQIRRGLATVNTVYGNESAVLLGDFLLSKVFQMCASLAPQVITMIADTTARLCQGELTQIAQRKNYRMTQTEYIDIITEKTARFFAACCQIGAILSKADDRKIQALHNFGLNTGIAFQITDDLLDITGDQKNAGKTLARDFNKNNLTLPMIHLLEQADESERKSIEDRMTRPAQNEAYLIDMLKSNGCIKYAHDMAATFAAKAVAAISDIKDSDAKKALTEIANFAAGFGIIK